MPINYIHTDLTTLDSVEAGVIVQQVNCQGVMGAGLAKALKQKWPVIEQDYKRYCAGHKPEELLGHIQTTQLGPMFYVCNVFGQLNYGHGHQTNETALLNAIQRIFQHAAGTLLSVYVPVNIGSGLAGGNHDQILNGIIALAKETDVNLYLDTY